MLCVVLAALQGFIGQMLRSQEQNDRVLGRDILRTSGRRPRGRPKSRISVRFVRAQSRVLPEDLSAPNRAIWCDCDLRFESRIANH